MNDDSIWHLNQLIETVQADGWTVTSIDADEYRDGVWADGPEEPRGVEIDLTVYIDYRDDERNPYRIK